jgi:adenylate cyclase
MTQESTQRKLAAILSADVKEYSRLMSQDERGTIRTLTTYKEAMSSLIQEYKGRVVDSPGDNLLAEFASVVDAVNCAVEIQRELAERNTELPAARQMDFRIGINLGDIVEEEKRIYGDGVNIAARLEGMAEGGGICISGNVHEQVRNKIGLEYEYLGEQAVKNIPEPVHAYRVLSVPGAAAHRVTKAKLVVHKTWRNAIIAVAAVLVLAAGAWAIWNFYFRPPPIEPASVEKMAYPLPDKPSIAVLPFENLSDDPAQENIVDGITDAIITGLSKTPEMFVIARNSTSTYKGKPVKVKQVSEELGVRYVLEGSVQKEGDRLRINVQLIDALKGHHLWAEKYDRDLKDLFALQDDITMKIIKSLQVKLTEGEQARLFGKGTDNLEAYLKFLQGRGHFLRMNKESNVLARQVIEEAIALDPQYPAAYIMLARIHLLDIVLGWSNSPRQSMAQATELAQKAITLDDSFPCGHGLLAWLYTMKRQHEKGIAEAERELALNPNFADSYYWLGIILHYAGRYEEAIPLLKKAIRLNPIPPSSYFFFLGNAYQLLGRYEQSIAAYKKSLHRNRDNLLGHMRLAATYSLVGREEEARAEVAEVMRIDPKFSLENLAKKVPYKNKADTERFVDALRKAGLK